MTQRLSGKVAVITGAGSIQGIGKEVALAMAAEGAKVVVNDISVNKDGTRGADKVVEIIKRSKGIAISNYDSIANLKGASNIIQAAVSNFGKIDILVNTAGNWLCKPTLEHTESDWDSIMNVHLKGLFGCTQAALKQMVEQQNGGRVINITSPAAFPANLGPGPAIAYCTAKAGVAGFTQSLALEFKQYGITVNAIAPVAVTKLFPIPGRVVNGVEMLGPDFVAPIIVYLATDEAKDISGQFIFSCSGDIYILALPFEKPEASYCLHKDGKWTLDELIEIMPQKIRK